MQLLREPRACLSKWASRREFLRIGGLGTVGLTLSERLRADGKARHHPIGLERSFGKANSCILLFMFGGPSQHETFDHKPLAPDGIRGFA
jgi:hypothetical protein